MQSNCNISPWTLGYCRQSHMVCHWSLSTNCLILSGRYHCHGIRQNIRQKCWRFNISWRSRKKRGLFHLLPSSQEEWQDSHDSHLKWLNQFLKKRKFHMETRRSIIAALESGDFLASINLAEVYLHVPIRKSHRQYLRFVYNTCHFQY